MRLGKWRKLISVQNWEVCGTSEAFTLKPEHRESEAQLNARQVIDVVHKHSRSFHSCLIPRLDVSCLYAAGR